jgi:hypothetical protein
MAKPATKPDSLPRSPKLRRIIGRSAAVEPAECDLVERTITLSAAMTEDGRKLVVLGTPDQTMGFTIQQAIDLGEALIRCAKRAKAARLK